MTRESDPSWPGRPLLAGAGIALGLPYVWYITCFIPPTGFVEPFTTSGYFAWFLSLVVLLVALAAAGLRRGGRGAAWGVAGLLGLLLVAMIADDLWRYRILGPGYRTFPLSYQPLLAWVHHWRAAVEAALLLLVLGAAALAAKPARRRWWSSRLGLMLLSACLPIVALEVALRADWIDPPFTA